jgi:hypothetical protein
MRASFWAALSFLPALALGAVSDDIGDFAGARGLAFRKKQLAAHAAHARAAEAEAEAASAALAVRAEDKKATPPFYTKASSKFYVDGTKIPDGVWPFCLRYNATSRRFGQLRRRPFLLWLNPHLGREERDAQAVLLVRAAYSPRRHRP